MSIFSKSFILDFSLANKVGFITVNILEMWKIFIFFIHFVILWQWKASTSQYKYIIFPKCLQRTSENVWITIQTQLFVFMGLVVPEKWEAIVTESIRLVHFHINLCLWWFYQLFLSSTGRYLFSYLTFCLYIYK